MLIRPAQKHDAPAIGELWLKLATYHRKLDAAMPHPAADGAKQYARRILQQLDDPYMKVFVAVDDTAEDVLVGYVMGLVVDLLPEMFEQERAGFLADIYVEPHVRGQGVGKALVSALRQWFKGRGLGYFEWYVAAANLQAIGFWQAMGGREVMLRMRAPTQDED